MREFKFRAWHKKAKEMLYSDKPEDVFKWLSERQPIEIMQATSYDDIHGKKMFEGDIIKQTIPYDPETKTGKFIEIGRIIYSMDQFEINDYPLYTCIEFKCEIIGNIYENPDLL